MSELGRLVEGQLARIVAAASDTPPLAHLSKACELCKRSSALYALCETCKCCSVCGHGPACCWGIGP